jgi:hypothetical protein
MINPVIPAMIVQAKQAITEMIIACILDIPSIRFDFLIFIFSIHLFPEEMPNGLRYLRWGGDGEAVQPEKCSGIENCL